MIELREGKKFVRRFLRYSIELRVVRSLLENVRYSDRVCGCKENVRRNVRYLIELRAVRSLLEGFRGIRLVESCEEFVRRRMLRRMRNVGI